jgi:hypothetical protein
MTERRIEGTAPATQQDIVADAMVERPKKSGNSNRTAGSIRR